MTDILSLRMKWRIGFLQLLVLGVILGSGLAHGEERIPFPKDYNFAGEIYNLARNTLPFRVTSRPSLRPDMVSSSSTSCMTKSNSSPICISCYLFVIKLK